MSESTAKDNNSINNSNSQPEALMSHNWFSETMLSKEDGVIATDTNGDITTMNKVAEDLTGWSFAESKGQAIDSIFDAINETTHLPIENPINKALKENKVTLLANHTILIKKDKTQRIIVDSAVPLHNDKAEIIGGALIFRDVTAQSLSKKKLDESAGMLNGILRNTGSIIYIKDLEGKYLLINKQAEKIYNIRASDLVGKNTVSHMSMIHSETSRRTDLHAIMRARLVESEEEIKHPDGTLHMYHSSKFPLFDSESNVYALCAILTDISESRQVDELKMQLAAKTLQKESNQQTIALVDRLQEKNKDLQQFVYTVSHDLRAPIARVLGLVTVSRIDPDFKINNKTILESVASELADLDNVVKDMNANIAIRDEEKYKEFISFDAELKLIEKVLDSEIKESNAYITADFDSHWGIITVKSYLYSIMYNLLSNAIKYRSSHLPLTIHLSSRQAGPFICLSVTDNGMGIDMEKYGDKIFGLYNRFHDKIAGKGIGLNLVKAQAESLGGKVEIESYVNQGSTFRIYFPINRKSTIDTY